MIRQLTLVLLSCSLAFASAAAPPKAATKPAGPVPMVDPAIDATGPFSYLAKPSTTIGLMGAERATQITFDGALYTGAAELVFLSGEPLKPILARQKTLAEGWLPIVQYGWTDGATSYSVECFGAALRDDSLTPTLNHIRVTVQNTGNSAAKANFATALRYSGKDHRFERLAPRPYSPDWKYEINADTVLRNGEAVLIFPKPDAIEAVTGTPYTKPFTGRDVKLTANAEACILHYTPQLAPGESRSLDFKMPLLPYADQADIQAAHDAKYDAGREKTAAWWRNQLAKGAQISIPESKVQDTYRASLMYDWMAIVQTKDGWKQQVNKLHYSGFWLRDAAYITRSYDLLGYFNLAEKTLRYFFQFQKPDGLFMSQPGQQDGYGNALWSLGHHYLLTGDRKWAEEIYHVYSPAIDWLKKTRAADEMHLLPPTHAHDNEQIQGRYTGYNFWALLGVRTAARIARVLGHEDEAKAYLAEYADYRAALMNRIEKIAGKDGYLPPGLDVQGGNDWANLTGVWPSEVLPPSDPHIATTLDKLHKEKYQEGIMTYGDKLHLYVTVKATENHIFRGEQEAALHDFYSFLLHTGSAHEGFEFGATPWGDRDVYHNFTPHGWGAAMYNIMLRNMLINEQGGNGGLDGRDLHLFTVISPEWAKPGEQVAITKAPTECGPISASMKFTDGGATVSFEGDFRQKPNDVVLHLPYFEQLTTYTTNATSSTLAGSLIFLSPDVKTVDLKWSPRKVEPLNFQAIVDAFKKEYARRFSEYTKSGNKPLVVEAPPLVTPDERNKAFDRTYAGADSNLALGKPVTVSGGTEGDHRPELAVDGDVSDSKAGWWAGPPMPRSLQVDLQQPTRIEAVQVFTAWDGQRWYNYKVEISEDGKTWTQVADKRDRSPAQESGDLHEFPPATARFVRVTVRKNSANPSAHLVEVRVFADKK